MDFFTQIYNKFFHTNNRLPTDVEILAIDALRLRISNLPEAIEDGSAKPDSETEKLLRDIHCSITANDTTTTTATYVSVGDIWKSFGFQNPNPLKDVRGGGILALQAMEYLLSRSQSPLRDEAKAAIKRRAYRENGSNYPWAAANVNIVHMVACLFQVVGSAGNIRGIVLEPKRYWSLLLDGQEGRDGQDVVVDAVQAFCQVHSCASILLDRLFTHMGASYETFPIVLAECKKRLMEHLEASEGSLARLHESVVSDTLTLSSL